MASPRQNPCSIGSWHVDPARNRIARNGEELALQPLSMDILVHLADQAGEVVSTEELLATFWPGRIASDDAVHRRIADIRKALGDDARAPTYIETIPKRGYRLIAPVAAAAHAGAQPAAAPGRKGNRKHLVMLVLTATAVLALAVVLLQNRPATAYEQALARAATLVADDQYAQAYKALDIGVSRTDRDARLTRLLDQILVEASLFTTPAGAKVEYRAYPPESGDGWQLLGETPLQRVPLARGTYQLRLQHEGRLLVLLAPNPGVLLNNVEHRKHVIEMPPASDNKQDMVWIPPADAPFGVWGLADQQDLGPFWMDRVEVRNEAYQEFVTAGGYTTRDYWQQLIAEGTIRWEDVASFTDTTGIQGPASWELGSYLPGEGQLPVRGISYAEARAYAAFRGKQLPGMQHWARAALSLAEWKWPLAPAVVATSNLDGSSPRAVASLGANSSHGLSDLVGNVAEWTTTTLAGNPTLIGGAWSDQAWHFNVPTPQSPLARPLTAGFRCMLRTDRSSIVRQLEIPVPHPLDHEPPQIDERLFNELSQQFEYSAGSLNMDAVVERPPVESEQWNYQRVLLPSGDPADPLPLNLYLPKDSAAPLQTLIYLPPADSWGAGVKSDDIAIEDYHLDFVPRSGRALIWPVYWGSQERYQDLHMLNRAQAIRQMGEQRRRTRDEIGRVLDYIAASDRFNGKVALLGLSRGVRYAPQVLAFEPRIDTAVFYGAGLRPAFEGSLTANHPVYFWSRVRTPVLLINGRYDYINPLRGSADRLLEMLGTSAEHKRSIFYDSAGHWPLPRNRLVRDTIAWLDNYLGPRALQN